jgi:hypothetical protein
VEFGIGMGVCQAFLFCGLTAAVVRSAAASSGVLWTPLGTLCLGLLAVLAATDALGFNRGEVTRLWIFMACFFQIPAAYACARLGRVAIALVLTTTLLHGALGSAMIAYVIP